MLGSLSPYPVHLSLGKLRKGHDNATESCFKSFRRIRCRSFGNAVRSHVGSNGENARRPWGARRRGWCWHSPERPYCGRKRVLWRWSRQVRCGRGRDRGQQQWAWASLQLKPVLVLPLAAGCRRIEPYAEPFDQDCHSQWVKKRGAMVHHAKWSRP